MPYVIFFGALVLIGAVLAFRDVKKRRRFATLLAARLSDDDRQIMLAQVPLVGQLPEPLQIKLEGKMMALFDQVTFIGCDGLEVTDEMELSIAAQACLLIVNTDAWYKHLRTILIYPAAFKSVQTIHDGYVVRQEEIVRLGESWSKGPVILSWADSQQGALNTEDGRNVVLHEFAHQLDDLSGQTNGIPLLGKGQSFAKWRQVIVDAFQRHTARLEQGRRTVLDAYGATGPEEFFAVAIEAFLEKPRALKEDEPALYDQLSQLLRLDPVAW